MLGLNTNIEGDIMEKERCRICGERYSDKDFEDAYFSDSMITKQLEESKDKAGQVKNDCNNCGHNYISCNYYPCSECTMFDKFQTKEVVEKLFEHLKQNLCIPIMWIEDVIDNIKGNGNKIQEIDIKRLENIVLNFKFLVRNNGQEQR